jgi:hypothetical protein
VAPKDNRLEDAGGGGGGSAGGGGGAAGKRTLTGGIVQKKDVPVPSDLSMRPKAPKLDGGIPKDLQPVQHDEVSEDVAAFRRALYAGERQKAMQLWVNINPAQQIRWSESETVEQDLLKMKSVLGTYMLTVMEDVGLSFDKRPQLLRVILRDKSAQNDWLASLARHPLLWLDYLRTLPDKDSMTDDEAKNIGKMILTYDDLEVAKKLFAHVYAPLRDDSYAPDHVHTKPWKMEWVHKLYNVISTHLPRQHVRTVKDFAIGYEVKEKGEKKFKHLGYAWWNTDRHVILNEDDTASKDGGGTVHSMTGGGKRGGNAANRFDVGALHETGHGVGQEMGGDTFTASHPYVGWQTGMNEDEWSKGLWGSDGDMKQRLWEKLGPKAAVLDASEARKYMAHRIMGKDYKVTTPDFDKAKDVEAFIRKHYADQKLTKYWERVVKGEDKKNVYSFKGEANVGDDDRVYVFLSRANDTLCSYNAVAWRDRVSTYAMSSPYEWFAEQYAHYYRLTPHGQGLEPGIKKKLDELHGVKYADPDATMKPGFDDAPSAIAGEAGDRQPFPW